MCNATLGNSVANFNTKRCWILICICWQANNLRKAITKVAFKCERKCSKSGVVKVVESCCVAAVK